MAAHGRYSLLHKIAEGGTAEVFLAHQLGSAGFKRLVVLKRVRPGLWADESFRRMLIDEAHISMALHHSNIVQVLDLGLSGPHYFLVFELVDGWSLSQVVKRARAAQVELPLNLALHVMAQVCRALAYAHSRTEGGVPMGIVHRDISPQNVLLSDQGEVKLADFGIAKARSRITTSQVGQVKGKPAYMSPEQATGAPLDARSDLFSLGTCLYWLVTGELPFSAPNELEALARVVHGNFVPPEKKRSGLPKPIARLITRALQREVNERFQSADEMLAELEKIQRSKVLPHAGQTELKAWLEALCVKDGARPIGWVKEVVVKAPAPASDQSEEIELVDDSDFVVVVTQASDAVRPVLRPPPPPGEWGWQRVLVMGGVAVGLVAGAYWATQGRGADPKATPPPTERSSPGAGAADQSGTPTQSSEPSGASLASPGAPSGSDAGVVDGGPSEGPADAGSLDGAVASMSAGGIGAAAVAVHQGGPAETDGGAVDASRPAGGETARNDAAPTADAGKPDAGPQAPPSAPPKLASVPPKAIAPTPLRPIEAPRAPARPPEAPRPPVKPKEQPTATAKPAAAASPEMVSVLFDSDPPGADVGIERKVFGKTPIPLRLKVGIVFELVFTKPGYHPHKFLYQVTSRQGQRVRVVLPRASSSP